VRRPGAGHARSRVMRIERRLTGHNYFGQNDWLSAPS
jgi:hypothetical protein